MTCMIKSFICAVVAFASLASFSFDTPYLTFRSASSFSIYGNGQVVLQGSAAIGASASWHDGKQSADRFFKTVLRLK